MALFTQMGYQPDVSDDTRIALLKTLEYLNVTFGIVASPFPEGTQALVSDDTRRAAIKINAAIVAGQGGSSGVFTALRNMIAHSFSSAGNTDLTKASEVEMVSTYSCSVGSGAGAYTRTLSLTTTNAENGDKAFVVLLMPASVNPTIEVRNATSGGTLLYTLEGTGAEFTQPLSFTFNGTAWESDQ